MFRLTTLLLLWPLLSIGQSQATIDAICKEIIPKEYPNIDGVLLKQGDQLLAEAYFNDWEYIHPHDTRSSFKGITSLLTGIAIDQGFLSLEDSLALFFPELKGQAAGSIKVEHLLTMTAGFNCEENYGVGPDCESEMWETKDWIDYAINVRIKDDPGKNWSYNSNQPFLMGEVVARASKMSIIDFATKYLFDPLDIKDYEWYMTPKGKGYTAGSFNMRPRDMLKISELIRNKGRWQGKRIVSELWIKIATDCPLDIDFSFLRFSKMANAKYYSATYGYYWYRERMSYGDIDTEVIFASGNGGQYMMYFEEYDLMVAFTGHAFGNWRMKRPFEFLLKYILPELD